MDGSSYSWGSSFFSWSFGGSGTGGYYWILVLQIILCVGLLYLGWRGARPPFHWMLLVWNIAQAGTAVYNALMFPESYRFQGDTLGVDVSLAWFGPAYFGGVAVLSILWVILDRTPGETPRPAWSRRNTILLMIVITMIPFQFFLLRFGTQHGTNDQIGVLLTMIQWVVLNWCFAARPKTVVVESAAEKPA